LTRMPPKTKALWTTSSSWNAATGRHCRTNRSQVIPGQQQVVFIQPERRQVQVYAKAKIYRRFFFPTCHAAGDWSGKLALCQQRVPWLLYLLVPALLLSLLHRFLVVAFGPCGLSIGLGCISGAGSGKYVGVWLCLGWAHCLSCR
jgi:hypothetical protein